MPRGDQEEFRLSTRRRRHSGLLHSDEPPVPADRRGKRPASIDDAAASHPDRARNTREARAMARVMDERCVDELRVAEDGLMQEKKTMNRPSGVIDGNQASVSNAMTIEVVGTHPAGAPMHVSTRNTSDRPSSSPSTRVLGPKGSPKSLSEQTTNRPSSLTDGRSKKFTPPRRARYRRRMSYRRRRWTWRSRRGLAELRGARQTDVRPTALGNIPGGPNAPRMLLIQWRARRDLNPRPLD